MTETDDERGTVGCAAGWETTYSPPFSKATKWTQINVNMGALDMLGEGLPLGTGYTYGLHSHVQEPACDLGTPSCAVWPQAQPGSVTTNMQKLSSTWDPGEGGQATTPTPCTKSVANQEENSKLVLKAHEINPINTDAWKENGAKQFK